MIRLEFVLRRKPGMSRADFQQYWREVHGPLVAKHSTTLGIHRYIQLHTLDDPVNDQLAEARGGMEDPYDGVAELWWTNPEALAATAAETGQAAAMELLEDERKFIDLANSPLWFAYEYPQFNPSEDIVAREHGPLVKLFFCFRHHQHQTTRRSYTGEPITARSFAASRRGCGCGAICRFTITRTRRSSN